MHPISSDSVSTLEMAKPIANELLCFENEALQVFDAALQRNVWIITPLLFCICDNPSASELLNHRGSTAWKFCHMCMVRNRVHGMYSLTTWNAATFWCNNRLTEGWIQLQWIFLERKHSHWSRSQTSSSHRQRHQRQRIELHMVFTSTTIPFSRSLLICTGTVHA